jgi:alpha,alpha-trehalase
VKRAQWLAALAAACLGCAGARGREPEASGDYPHPREALFGDLFVAVQIGGIFTDGKTFVDAVPDAPPAALPAAYHTAHPQSPEQLRSFVEQHFSPAVGHFKYRPCDAAHAARHPGPGSA